MATCSVKNKLGGWDYYRTSQGPKTRTVSGQVALNDALPGLPSDAHLVGQGKVARGAICGGGVGMGEIPGEVITIGTWAVLGMVGLVLWKIYG